MGKGLGKKSSKVLKIKAIDLYRPLFVKRFVDKENSD